MSVTHGAALVKAVVCLTVSVSLCLSIQRHHREGQGQALPPRLLHVRRLRRQPQAERLLLHRGQPVLWDPRQGTRPASRGLRCCCCLPQLQGGAGLRWRWSRLYCTILKSGRTGLLSILAYIYQALSSRNLNLDQFCFWEGHKKCMFQWSKVSISTATDVINEMYIEHFEVCWQSTAWIRWVSQNSNPLNSWHRQSSSLNPCVYTKTPDPKVILNQQLENVPSGPQSTM